MKTRLSYPMVALPLYGVVIFGACVGVLPFVDDDHVVLVRQDRYVQRENHRWEIPTGGVTPGETPAQAAQRELQEEVGYAAGRLAWISTYSTSKSVYDETAHLFLGYDLVPAALPPMRPSFSSWRRYRSPRCSSRCSAARLGTA